MYYYDIKDKKFFREPTEQSIAVSDDEAEHLLSEIALEDKVLFIGDGKLKLSESRPSEYHEWSDVESKWIITTDNRQALLKDQRQQIRDAINTLRDKIINGGVYVSQIDKWVDTDEQGRSTLVEIKADFDLNGKDNTYTLICADNTARVINFDEFKTVWDAVKTLKEKMFENAYMHKVLLEHSDDPLTYDWSIGWSKTYAEHLTEVGNE